MSFSFLDNLDVEDDDPEQASLTEVPETPSKLDIASVKDEASPKPRKKRTRFESQKEEEETKSKHSGDVDDQLHSQSSGTPSKLRRSKRLAKKTDVDQPDETDTRKKKGGRKTRKKQLANDDECPELVKQDHLSSEEAKTPPKNEIPTRLLDETVKSPISHEVSTRDLKKLPTTPGPAHGRSLLKVALGNATRKENRSRNSKQKSSGPAVQAPAVEQQQQPKLTTNGFFKEPVTATAAAAAPPATSDEDTKVHNKRPANHTNKKAKARTTVTAEETEPIVPLKRPVTQVQSANQNLPSVAAGVKRTSGDDSAVGFQLPVAKLRKQRTTTVVARTNSTANNQSTRIPMLNVDPNRDGVKFQITEPQQTGPTMIKKSSPPKVSSNSRQIEKPSPRRGMPVRQNAQDRRSLKSIVKKSSIKQNKEKTHARVTMALAAATLDNSIKKETKVVAPRKSSKLADQYKHVQSKVAQMINGTLAISAPKVRELKNASGNADNNTRTASHKLHEKPFVLGGRVTSVDDGRSKRTTMAPTAVHSIANVHKRNLSRQSRAGGHLQSVRSTKSMVPSYSSAPISKQTNHNAPEPYRGKLQKPL